MAKSIEMSRRSIIAGAASLPITALPAMADSSIDDLWRERIRRVGEQRALSARIDAAKATMPAWALPGPMFMNGDGERCQEISGWPEVADPQPPRNAGKLIFRIVRPSPRSLKRDFENAAFVCGRAPALREYRAALRRLVARRREQDSEIEKRGIPELEAFCDEAYERVCDVQKRIEDLPPSPTQAAALVLTSIIISDNRDDAEVILQALRPSLSGEIAKAADEVLSAPTGTPAERFAWA